MCALASRGPLRREMAKQQQKPPVTEEPGTAAMRNPARQSSTAGQRDRDSPVGQGSDVTRVRERFVCEMDTPSHSRSFALSTGNT